MVSIFEVSVVVFFCSIVLHFVIRLFTMQVERSVDFNGIPQRSAVIKYHVMTSKNY